MIFPWKTPGSHLDATERSTLSRWWRPARVVPLATWCCCHRRSATCELKRVAGSRAGSGGWGVVGAKKSTDLNGLSMKDLSMLIVYLICIYIIIYIYNNIYINVYMICMYIYILCVYIYNLIAKVPETWEIAALVTAAQVVAGGSWYGDRRHAALHVPRGALARWLITCLTRI